MKKHILFLLFNLLIIKGFSQNSTSPYERYTTYMLTVRGGVALPQSGMSDFIDNNGVNFSVSMDWVLKNNISFGAEIGYMTFRKFVPRRTYSSADGGVDVSAVQNRAFNIVPLTLTGSYYLASSSSLFRPYIQVGGGIAYVDYTNYWGYLLDDANKMKLTTRAAIGVKLNLKKTAFGSLGADIRVGYQATSFDYNFAKSGGK
jgi:outer membrane protein W